MKSLLYKELQKVVPLHELDTWFTPLRLDFDKKAHILSVTFPHTFFRQWFENTGQEIFEKTAHKVLENMYVPQAHIEYVKPNILSRLPSFFVEEKTCAPNAQSQCLCVSEGFFYNTKNSFLIETANAVAQMKKALIYNPFIIYGKSGTGKTHILTNMHKMLSAYGTNNSKIFFGSGEEFWQCLQTSKIPDFVQNHTVFIIDDMHRIPTGEKTHEHFVTFMDACFKKHRQIIFSSLYSPENERTYHETVRSRFHKGLIIEIKLSDIDVRMRYALAHARDLGLKLSRAHLLLLAQRCEHIPFLSGIMLKVCAFASFSQIDITTADLENIIVSSGGEKKQLQPRDIIRLTATHFSLQEEQILGTTRLREIVIARQIALYLCKELMGLSSPALGKIFGGRDHSTVIHSIKKIKQLVERDKEMHLHITEIKKKIFTS